MAPLADPSLLRFRLVIEAALAQLEARREEVNDLNVFPVADGDTGDNMALTLRAVLKELDDLSTQGEIDEIGREQIVDSVARAALLGARGNSGVILSQLIRGAAEELISRPGELVDPVLVAAAMARAADRAYGSVRDPAEGTILTVVREMAARASSEIAHMAEPRLQHRVDDATQNEMLAYVLEHALDAGQASVKRGPELLPVLREAGVVDAGGYGLTIIFAGVIAALRGADPPPLEHYSPARARSRSTPRRPTATARTSPSPAKGSSPPWVARLERLGDSVLVVGDAHTLKVHVHTDEPERATALFDGAGTVSRLDVADMHEQVAAPHAAPPRARSRPAACWRSSTATACACSSRASARTCSTAARRSIRRPTSSWPASTRCPPRRSSCCRTRPTSAWPPSARRSCRRSRCGSCRPARWPPGWRRRSRSIPRAARPRTPPRWRRPEGVRTGGVTEAARDDTQGRFRRGDSVGFIDEQLVAWGEPGETLEIVLGELGREAELLTVIEGDGAPLGGEAVAALAPESIEVELERGGQPAWWWLVSAEWGLQRRGTTTSGHAARRMSRRKHAAEQHAPHRSVVA